MQLDRSRSDRRTRRSIASGQPKRLSPCPRHDVVRMAREAALIAVLPDATTGGRTSQWRPPVSLVEAVSPTADAISAFANQPYSGGEASAATIGSRGKRQHRSGGDAMQFERQGWAALFAGGKLRDKVE